MERKPNLLTWLLAATISLATSLPASADPGTPTVQHIETSAGGVILVTSRTVLRLPASPPMVAPNDTTETPLPGGVTAWSTAGMQWRHGVFFHDVSGLTRSETSSPIDEIETHGALVRSGAGVPCYEGDQVWIQPSIINQNSSLADSGWSPFSTGRNGSTCWVVATGHYYIYLGTRTDVAPVDIVKRF